MFNIYIYYRKGVKLKAAKKVSPFFSLYWFFAFKTRDPSLNSIPMAKLKSGKMT